MEQVLVVRRQRIAHFLNRHGIITERRDELLNTIMEQFEFMPRADAETDTDYKQVIPYVTIMCGERVFASKRLGAGGEARLHGLISIGFGGHINPSDSEVNPLMDGLIRELSEEIKVEYPGKLTFRGIINNDTDDVGRVHLGMLYTLETDGDVSIVETEKLEGLWLELAKLSDYHDGMETWSQLVSQLLTEDNA